MTEIAEAVRVNRDYLVQLDAAIGDGDHGINMTRGFDAVVRALAAEPQTPPGKLLTLAGKTLVSSVGGASGPLWGSALRRAGRTLGEAPNFEAEDLAGALEAALAAVQDLGQARPGDKTMVDALAPAVAILRQRVTAGQSLEAALQAASAAAEEGMRATVPMQARKGRASYLGERSIGHQDPGATSAALIMTALERTVADRSPQ
ncbi:MAG: dihydroxyacetone kinase subunit DhaL [Candidatus Dormibacteraeota bacterium]|nr:dihydroxyacetone kinase subunit DhaL [Candidatus Dormibacteraeota bacterium]